MRVSLCLVLLLYSFSAVATSDSHDSHFENIPLVLEDGKISTQQVREPYRFSGLATYFNNIIYYVVRESDIRQVDQYEDFELREGEWLAIVGRFKVILIKQPGISLRYSEDGVRVLNPGLIGNAGSAALLVEKPQLPDLDPLLNQVRYAHLWSGLAALAAIAEYLLVYIHNDIVGNWGITIFLFSVIVKILLFPLTRLTRKSQDRVNLLRTQLEPEIARIKQHFDGEEAHNKIMGAHKNLGITPFFSLKPMLITLTQLPILIAIFNALGEMPQFSGQSFLWIEDLAYPDMVGLLPFQVPLLGDRVSLLPFLMSGVTLLTILVMNNRGLPASAIRSQRLNLVLMSIGFLILFYPFPSSMVLYWTFANLLQLLVSWWESVRSS